MFVRAPRCGNLVAHQAHPWQYDIFCEGWTDEQEAVEKLCRKVQQWASVGDLAERGEEHKLTLVAHPLVVNLIRTHVEPDYGNYIRMTQQGEEYKPLGPQVDILQDSSLPKGSWMFVVARGTM